jgi:hypothetical protein
MNRRLKTFITFHRMGKNIFILFLDYVWKFLLGNMKMDAHEKCSG